MVTHAGDVVFDSDGNVVRFTPNATPTDKATWAAVICSALGGNPAWPPQFSPTQHVRYHNGNAV